MAADDDGIVEAYPVLCITGSSEDDLRVLVSKQFVTILNQDIVTFINDWREHNNIRADRKKDSIYKDLLLEVVPDAQLVEPRKNVCLTIDGQTSDKPLTNVGLGKDRLGKDRLGKDRLGKDRLGKDRENINYQQVADMYNETCVSFPRLTKLSETRKKAIRARLKQYSVDDFRRMFELAESSDFLKGKNDRNWSATFDWMIKDANMAKILDGNYNEKKGDDKSEDKPRRPAADYYTEFLRRRERERAERVANGLPEWAFGQVQD